MQAEDAPKRPLLLLHVEIEWRRRNPFTAFSLDLMAKADDMGRRTAAGGMRQAGGLEDAGRQMASSIHHHRRRWTLDSRAQGN
ncbi:hypothetical protein E2562_012347 [Oryza meyeriana var. granulata]|uniref:Uncharacterized protein n=1 Tax=Oryza meyeriana var. granulata TaxID=110450 RepID=A0A6G1DHG1_9ORYZ|nr:hypothetical protein E2562_012347 [Oryza meyeriana var. granulata]